MTKSSAVVASAAPASALATPLASAPKVSASFTPVSVPSAGAATASATAADVKPEAMWNPTAVVASIHASLSIIASRVPSIAYAETWIPSADGKSFTGSEWYLCADLSEGYGAIARENVGRVEHATQMNKLSDALETQEPVILPNVDKHQIYYKFIESKPLFKSGVVVPIVNNGQVHALICFYANAPTTITSAEAKALQALSSGIVAAGIYGATPAQSALSFTQHHPEVPLALQQEVYHILVANGVFSAQKCFAEVDYFFKMGLAPVYFNRFGAKIVANHIQAYIASKQFSHAAQNPDDIWLAIENNVKFMGGLPPEQSLHMVPYEARKIFAVERNITRRIKMIPATKAYSLEMSMSSKPLSAGSGKKMALYVLQTHDYANPSKLGDEKCVDINDIASTTFLKEKSQTIKDRYSEIIAEAAGRLSPVAKVYPEYRDGTIPLMFAFRYRDPAGPTTNYMLNLTQLLVRHNLQPVRKFVETFANNLIVFSLYLSPSAPQSQIARLMKQFSMLHLVPQNEVLTPKFLDGSLSAEEYTYLSAAARVLYYIIGQRPDEYNTLSKQFKNDALNLGRLRSLYTSLRREAVSLDRIMHTLLMYPQLVSKIYQDFELRATTDQTEQKVPRNTELEAEVARTCKGNMSFQIFNTLLSFNKNVLKTNFFRAAKAAISFRFDSQLFADMDLPALPFGVFFVMGADFQGFHVRFADVSRGGIRLVRSRDDLSYSKNLATQFQETFNLAFTQNLKNKDIPEFGSKGTILLNPESQTEGTISFQRYVSAVLDLIIPAAEPENAIVNNYGRDEALFFGPDEGTAGVMEWAALYSKKRGYKYWRAFTTGKPPSLGGIPHDTFGMTTTSVHRFVVGCIEKLGLKEEECTKVQTGGPDGDLGSNEILISKDKTTVIIDGMGVAYDPAGLNRDELSRLAKERVTIDNFNKSLLGPGGFLVTVNDTNVTLPSGEKVESGVQFRNDFHLHPLSTADLFVPCGGRPESINLNNVNNLLDAKTGKPKFRIIVEGANLFITQDARLILEEAGVVLYKDASANKGGVTSSSLEVLAALGVDDVNFAKHMAVHDGHIPEFYMKYVNEIKDRITADAGHEFECIWREHLRTGVPRFLLTDRVSNKINQLNFFVHDSNLWENLNLRRVVLEEAIPKRLQELVGLDGVIANAPESYIRAIFSAYLASRYVYKYGVEATEFAFFDFMQPYVKKAVAIENAAKKA